MRREQGALINWEVTQEGTMDRRDMEELARRADRQTAADLARDATLRASNAARKSADRAASAKPASQGRQEDPGPVEGASGR